MSRLVTKATAALLFLGVLLAVGRPVYGQELTVSGQVTSVDDGGCSRAFLFAF